MRIAVRALITVGVLVTAPAGSFPAQATPPIPPPYYARIRDLDYIPRTYYFLADHPADIDLSTLRVYRDDRIQTNNAAAGSIPGIARLDPTVPSGDLNPEILGWFDYLSPGEDYGIFYPWPPPALGRSIPVLQLKAPLAHSDLLAVAYVDDSVPARVGTVTGEEVAAEDTVLGKPPGMLLLKALNVYKGDISVDPVTGWFDPGDPWYPVLSYELRNFYDLGIRDTHPGRLRVNVRRIDVGSSVDPHQVSGIPFLQILGLDQRDSRGFPDPDGIPDAEYVDYSGGRLFFPDLHPFDPDTVSFDCPTGFGGFLCLDDLARNLLRRDSSDEVLRSNPGVYYAFNPDPFADTRFYLEVSLLPPPPHAAILHQNAPNPFNPETRIRFDLLRDAHVRLTVHDVRGRLVETLVDKDILEGSYGESWSGLDQAGARAPSGIYYYVLDLGEGVRYSRRMVLVR